MKVGDLVRFVPAPPRWNGEKQRNPTDGLLNKLAVILDWHGNDAHDWGGIWKVALVESDTQIQYYGDFMEVLNEGR
jgi:hypothetical protein